MRFIHPILAFCLFCLLVTETVAVDSSAMVVESTFEQDLEGWTTYGDGFLLRRYPTGGNLGGYMWAHDMAWGPTSLSCTPWPQTIFLSYYLEDTSLENGCFQVIPGTHLKRIPLHDQLVTAHEQGARFIEESHPIMFSHHPDQVDVLTKAGSLVLGDARVLHAARKNQTAQRRNLLLLWHSRPKTVPDYWEGEIPLMFVEDDPETTYPSSRVPGQYLPA